MNSGPDDPRNSRASVQPATADPRLALQHLSDDIWISRDYEVTVTRPKTGDVLVQRANESVFRPQVAIQLPHLSDAVDVSIQLAGNLAYAGTVVREGVFDELVYL